MTIQELITLLQALPPNLQMEGLRCDDNYDSDYTLDPGDLYILDSDGNDYSLTDFLDAEGVLS